jgi:purine nucleoside phosphorylase
VQVPDRYVFGFGMDFHEQGRNLPAIYALSSWPDCLSGHRLDLAVIGGTGVYALANCRCRNPPASDTPYGAPSGPIRLGTYAGKRVAFLARHGEGHSLPPHKVNYRANLAALKAIGATRVLAMNTVGGITALAARACWPARTS